MLLPSSTAPAARSEPIAASATARALPVADPASAERAGERRLRALLESLPVIVYSVGPLPPYPPVYVSSGVSALGFTTEEWLSRPDMWTCLLHPDDRDWVLAETERAMSAGEAVEYEYRLVDKDGRVHWIHDRGDFERDADGALVAWHGVMLDVTERREAEAHTRRLTQIIETTPDIVAVSTPDGRVDYVNAVGRQLLGLPTESEAGQAAVRGAGLTVLQLQPQFAPGGTQFEAVQLAVRDGAWRGETVLVRPDGRELPVEQVLLAHRGPTGEVEFVSSLLRDISDRKHVEATLRAFALVDDLTGLYNRRGFLALADREWERARAAGQGAVLVYVDLDDLKPINDTFGHSAGDAALREAAAVLRRVFREADVVGRLGGDEFVALALCGADQDPGEVAAWMRARLQRAVVAANEKAERTKARPWRLALSAGAAQARAEAPTSLAALMAEADATLYEVKRTRKAERSATPAA